VLLLILRRRLPCAVLLIRFKGRGTCLRKHVRRRLPCAVLLILLAENIIIDSQGTKYSTDCGVSSSSSSSSSSFSSSPPPPGLGLI